MKSQGFSDPSNLMRRDVARANTAVAVVLVAVLALALAAVLAGLQATRNERRAEEAEASARQRLASAYLAEARAARAAAQPGRREEALNALSNALSIHPSSDLRTETAACLALADLAQEGPLLPTPRELQAVEMDSEMEEFAYGDPRGNVTVCLDRTNQERFTLEADDAKGGERNAVVDLGLSPDKRLLAVRHIDGTLVLWDLPQRRPLDFGSSVALTAPSFSPDARSLVFSDRDQQGRISVLDLETLTKHPSSIRVGVKVFRMKPDMSQVAVATGKRVDMMDFPRGTNSASPSLNHSARVTAMAWTPDGRGLASACEDGNVYLWDVRRGGYRILPGHGERCVLMGFSADGKRLFSSSRDGTTRVWDVVLGELIATGEGMASHFSPDGTRLGFWRAWLGFGVWRILPSSVYSLRACDTAAGPLLSLDLSVSGRWCVATQNEGFHLWDLRDERDVYIPMRGVLCVRVSSDEKSLFVCGQTGLEKWPLPTNSTGALSLRQVDAEIIPLPDSRGARGIALSTNSQVAAIELTDRRFVVIDVTGHGPPVFIKDRWRQMNFKGPGSFTGAGRFAISPDARWVATGFDLGKNDVPKIWDARSGELVKTLNADSSVVAFSPDGQWLGLAGVERCSLWSVGDWVQAREFARDGPSLTHGALAFTREGAWMAVASTRQIVQLREPFSGRKLANLVAPAPQSVNSIRLSLDGSTLVTATANDMVEMWRLDRLRRDLAAMDLDWGNRDEGPEIRPATAPNGRRWLFTLAASLGGFGLAAGFTLLTLRRHRAAIERFVVAEAQAVQRNRELDMAKVELMHSQKMQALGTLAAGIAHDFNNLLSVIRMSGKLIGRDAKGHEEIQEHVADIEQAVLHGKNVVGSMLGYARLEEGEGKPTEVTEAVENVVSLLSEEFLSGIALTLELEREAPRVEVGRGRLEQILLNLLVNASEAMGGEGKLKIAVHTLSSLPERHYVLRPGAAREFIELSVTDSGPGINPDIRERIFEPFFTTKRSGSKAGTGLGLSLVYSIAQQSQLGLTVESEPGQGTAFSLVIPVKTPVRQTHSAEGNDPSYIGGENGRGANHHGLDTHS